MPLYVMTGRDWDDKLETRKETRPAHLAWIEELGSRIKMAGPVHEVDGGPPVGSVIVLEADDLNAAKTVFASDPYAHAGLWAAQDIRPFTWVKP